MHNPEYLENDEVSQDSQMTNNYLHFAGCFVKNVNKVSGLL